MTDEDLSKPVAILRALLTADFDTYRRLGAELDPSANSTFAVVLGTAFIDAVDRHFGQEPSAAKVIDFVAEARASYSTAAQIVSTEDAERVIRAALGEDHLLKGMSANAIATAQSAMLFALVQQDGPSTADVDALLARASEEANGFFRRRSGR